MLETFSVDKGTDDLNKYYWKFIEVEHKLILAQTTGV